MWYTFMYNLLKTGGIERIHFCSAQPFLTFCICVVSKCVHHSSTSLKGELCSSISYHRFPLQLSFYVSHSYFSKLFPLIFFFQVQKCIINKHRWQNENQQSCSGRVYIRTQVIALWFLKLCAKGTNKLNVSFWSF